MTWLKAKFLLIVVFLIFSLSGTAQPFSTIDLSKLKPEEHRKKIFRSEKTTTDELNKFSLFLQNLYSQYNFLFNANDQMKRLLEEAKKSHQDDYSKLLTFYPYDVQALSQNKYLDTVVEKATTGIIMHDLRSKWVDELYFVLGNAYFFQEKYDSAAAVYQYINFAFSPRDDGYFVPIGSNVSNSDNVFSMITQENVKSLLSKFASSPKRNDAFLWQIRNYIDSGNVFQANSYIQLLRNDAHFPERLRPYFDEIQAYYYYTLHRWDSSAHYLTRTMDITGSNAQKARKEFLIAQLFSRTDSLHLADAYFERAANRTIDPELELYANVNRVALAENTEEENENDKKINELEQLASREKFYKYRDLIYYRQAKIFLQNGDTEKAKDALHKSIKYNVGNPQQRSRSFMQLAALTYRNNDYKSAVALLDSITASFIQDKNDSLWLSNAQAAVTNIKDQYTIINRNDSILALVAMPEREKMAFLEKEARRIRRMVARQDNEDAVVNLGNTTTPGTEQPTVDIFGANTASGEWYFNSQNAKNAGYSEFVRKYGNRKNEDNWIRSSRLRIPSGAQSGTVATDSFAVTRTIDSTYVTAEDLLMMLPDSEEEKRLFTDSINTAIFSIGKDFQNQMMDFEASTQYYRDYIFRSSKSELMPEVLYNLYVSSYLARNGRLADSARNALLTNYAESDWAKIIQSQQGNLASISSSSIANDTTKVYDMIYQFFLEGKFEEALANKKAADEMYGTHYWTPQLLYIEGVYYVTQNNDSTAIQTLETLRTRFANSEMAKKAEVMINVLKRRSEIEKYLAELQISPYSPHKEPVIARTNFVKPKEESELWKDLPKDVVIVLDKEGNPIPRFPRTLQEILKEETAIALPPASEEETVVAKTEEQQPVQQPEEEDKVAVVQPPEPAATDSTQQTRVNPFETPATPPVQQPKPEEQFKYEKAVITYAVVVLDNVDQVYLNEVGNAFNRFNLIMFENIEIQVQQKPVGERYQMLLLGPFKDGYEAGGYVNEIAPNTQSTIIPWLDNSKYLIRTINKNDLDKITEEKDLENYLKNHR